MISLYRKNFANLFSASKIRRQSMLDKDDSDDDSRGSESESEDEDSNLQAPFKKLKSDKESSQNLVGLDSSGEKDPFSILKEKNENLNLNFNENSEIRDEILANKSSNELKEIIIQKKEADLEDVKNHSETSKSELDKKQPESNKSNNIFSNKKYLLKQIKKDQEHQIVASQFQIQIIKVQN